MEGNDKPGTSGDTPQISRKDEKPIQAARARRALSLGEKEMVANVYKYVCDEAIKDPIVLKPSTTECVEKTAFILKLSRGTIYSVLKEGKEGGLTAPKKSGPKRDFRDKISDETFNIITKLVEDLIRDNKVPTMKNIYRALKDHPDVPKYSLSTMALILKHLRIVPAVLPRKGVALGKRQKKNEVQALQFVDVENKVQALQFVDVEKEVQALQFVDVEKEVQIGVNKNKD